MSSTAIHVSRMVVSPFAGVLTGLLVGSIAVALAADDGLGDLTAAASTKVLLVPAGLSMGAGIGWWLQRNADDGALWALRSSDGGLERPL